MEMLPWELQKEPFNILCVEQACYQYAFRMVALLSLMIKDAKVQFGSVLPNENETLQRLWINDYISQKVI